jgi:hypothetical protein
MTTLQTTATGNRYAKCNEVSKRVRWDIERDVIRGRAFEPDHKFLPDGLSFANRLPFLSSRERKLFSRVQGRTYANMFALVERYIGAKMMELSREHALGDQDAAEALVRLTDEELKHQALFRRIEALAAAGMPAGYRFVLQANDVASFVLGKSSWGVLALTCHIEIFSQVHCRESIEPDGELSPLFKDVFFFHWKEEAQHAILDELEWRRIDTATSAAARDAGVDDLIALIAGIDGMLQAQAKADSDYFLGACGSSFTAAERANTCKAMLRAYRWQYIVSGAQEPRFANLLGALVTREQAERIGAALGPIVADTQHEPIH